MIEEDNDEYDKVLGISGKELVEHTIQAIIQKPSKKIKIGFLEKELRKIYTIPPEDIDDVRDDRGRTFLMWATKFKNHIVVEKLLHIKCDPTLVDNNHKNVLIHAHERGAYRTAEIILHHSLHHVNPKVAVTICNQLDNEGHNALFYACNNCAHDEISQKVILTLVDLTKEFNTSLTNESILTRIVGIGEGFGASVIQKIVKKGADVNLKIYYSNKHPERFSTAVSIAVGIFNHLGALYLIDVTDLELLDVEYFFNPEKQNETLLSWLIRHARHESSITSTKFSTLAIELIRRGVKNFASIPGQGSVFRLACNTALVRTTRIAEELLDAGFDPTKDDGIKGDLPLISVCKSYEDQNFAIKIIDAYIKRNNYSFLMEVDVWDRTYIHYAQSLRLTKVLEKTQQIYAKHIIKITQLIPDLAMLIAQYMAGIEKCSL